MPTRSPMRALGRHANVVALQAVLNEPASDDLYLVLDYADAGPLMSFDAEANRFTSRLTGGPLPIGVARQCLADLVAALAFLHARGVAHRDIKPENLLLDSAGMLRVCDFSVSQLFAHGPGGAGAGVGAAGAAGPGAVTSAAAALAAADGAAAVDRASDDESASASMTQGDEDEDED